MINDSLVELKEAIMLDLRLGRVKLPSLPEVAVKIRQALYSERHNASQLAKIVQLDPALTTRLIRIANSVYYGSSTKVDTCRAAIARLGLPATRNVATSLSMHHAFKTNEPKLRKHLQTAWNHGYRVAATCYVLAEVSPSLEPDKAMLAGLVHNIGVLPLIPYLERFPEIIERPVLVERITDSWQGKFGAQLLKYWNFDDSMVQVPLNCNNWMRAEGEKLDYVDAVLIARVHALLADPAKHRELPPLQQMPAFRKLPSNRFGQDGSLRIIQEAKAEIAMLMQLLKGSQADEKDVG